MWHSHDQAKMDRITSVQDEFALETRLVVLNFMGLMPSSCPPTAVVDWPSDGSEHRGSLNGHGFSSQDQGEVMLSDTSSGNLIEESESEMKSLEDQSSEPCTLIRKGAYVRLLTMSDTSCNASGVLRSISVVESGASGVNGTCQSSANLQTFDLDAPSVSIIPASPADPQEHNSQAGADMSFSVPGLLDGTKSFTKSLSSDATEDLICKSLNGNQSKRSSIVSCRLSPPREETSLSTDRQHSLQSCLSGSTRSLASMRRNSYVDVRHVDVRSLIRAQTLSPVAVTLKEEISKGIVDLEKSYAHTRTEKPTPPASLFRCQSLVSLSGIAVSVSPESQVADMLRAIGDRVQDDYTVYLNNATDQLLQQQHLGQLTYDVLQEAAVNLLRNSAAGWTQIALVLLMSQRLSLTLLEQGDRSVGKLAEYTSRFITDHIADFILSRGGWQSISELGVTETPLSYSQDLLLCSSSVDAVSSDTSLDPVTSVSAAEFVDAKIESSKSAANTTQQHLSKASSDDIPLRYVSQCNLSTASLSADENPSLGLSGREDESYLEENSIDLFADNKSRFESESVDESCTLESFFLLESDDSKIGFYFGVVAVALFGTWIVYNGIRKD